MKVVVDSSVLISLSAISQLELLRKRFPEVTIPQAVQQEVVIEGKGQPGSREVQASSWIRVQEVHDRPFVRLLEAELDPGESEMRGNLGLRRSNLGLHGEATAKKVGLELRNSHCERRQVSSGRAEALVQNPQFPIPNSKSDT
jgi:predicted nucleic acid-binding protein